MTIQISNILEAVILGVLPQFYLHLVSLPLDPPMPAGSRVIPHHFPLSVNQLPKIPLDEKSMLCCTQQNTVWVSAAMKPEANIYFGL